MSLTVIVPFYNDSLYIEKCITSLKCQDLDEFSVLLLDDGSTDNSAKICKRCIENDERFTFISLEHRGVSYARNYGLNQTDAEFVTFVDADDEIESGHLRILMESISNPATCMAAVGMKYVTEQQRVVFQLSFRNKSISVTDALKSTLEPDGIGGFVWNKIFRLSVIKQNKIKFDESLRKYEDLEFVFSYLLATSGNVVISSSMSYIYVKHEDSVILATGNSSLQEDIFPYEIIDFKLQNSTHVGVDVLISDAMLGTAFGRLRKHISQDSDQEARNYVVANLNFMTIAKTPKIKRRVKFVLMWIFVRIF